MKQRLLLALLVLFAAVGMVKGAEDVSFTAPQNSGDISITLTGTGMYKDNITITGGAPGSDYTSWTRATTSKTLKLPNNSSGSSTWTISGSAYTSLTISGKIGTVTVNHSGLTSLDISNNKVQTLNLTDASALVNLYCQDNLLAEDDWDVSSLTQLKTIDCSNNQLTGTLTVPNTVTTLKCGGNQLVDVTGQASNASITFGTQSLNSNKTVAASNKWFSLKDLIGSGNGKVDIFSDASEKVSFGTIQKYNSINSSWGTANVHRNGNTSTEYKFQSSTAYENGTYRVQVTNSDNKYKGYTYLVTFQVDPAEFSIKLTDVTATYEGGAVTPGTTLVKAGKKIKITAVTKTGKTFSSFEQVGLKTPLAEGSDIEAVIVGPTPTDDIDKQVVSIKALYTTNTCKITLGKVAEGGSFIVVDKDNKEIVNNGTVPYDSKITIIATAADKYELDQIVVNGTNITSSITTDGAVSKYSIDKVTENKDINVTFKAKGGGNKTVKAIYPASLCSVSVNGEDAPSSGGDISNVTGNAIKVIVTPQSGKNITVKNITLNNTSASTITKKQNGIYEAVFTVKAEDSKIDIAVTAIELTKITVISSDDNDKYTYDGTTKPFAYTTNPAGLKLDVTYATSSGGTYTATTPVNAGTYYVKYSRKADDKYAEVTEVSNEKVEIAKASLTLKAPTVGTKTENGVMSYTISNGSAQLNSKTITGSFKVSGQTDLLVPTANQTASHLVKLEFVPKDDIDKDNFNKAEVQVPVKIGDKGVDEYTIKGTLKDGISVQIMNGAALLATWTSTNTTGIKVPKNAPIKLKFIVPSTVTIQKVLQNDASATLYTLTDNAIDLTSQTTDVNFILSTEAVTDNRKFYTIQTRPYNYEPVYDGSVKLYPTDPHQTAGGWTAGIMTSTSHPQLIDINGTDFVLTYIYKQNDNVITSPVDAGTYTVEITATPGSSDEATYKETKATATMVIKKATPEILTLPTASAVGKGQVLGSSILTGGSATITGKFTWSNPKTVVNANGTYQITFTPENTTNYGNAYKDVTVTITTKSILSVVEENCKITVTGSDNKTYKNGMEVPVGITLTFTVVPNNTYKLANLIVNGTALSGNTYKVTAAPISVKAELSQEFTVSVTKPDKGTIVTLPSSNKVKTGESYSFTVACLAADKSKIVVKDGSTLISSTDGKYTISNITADKNISITLDNPTAITVAADTTLSPHKKPMGAITITGTTDGKCYYGQTVTVKATPVSGVQFAGWTGTTETTATFSFKATQPSYKFKAKYTGSPTGIETIEGIRIYGTEGAIYIGCDGDARVTIISMEGRVKKAEISGDTRIEMAAGIYGVILEKGSKVMKTKVIVR